MDRLPPNISTKLLGQLDCMVARFTSGKQDQSAVKLESLSQAKRQVLEGALELEVWRGSGLAALQKALAECGAEPTPTQATRVVGSTVPLQEYRDGRLADTLATVRAKGFDGGSMAVKKDGPSDQTYEILDAKSGFAHVVG